MRGAESAELGVGVNYLTADGRLSSQAGPGTPVCRERLFRPDDLPLAGMPGAPAIGELGHQEQAAAAFIEGTGTAQMRGRAAGIENPADQRCLKDASISFPARGSRL